MPNKFLKLPFRQKASALVTTLMVIVVLTVIVVAFMESMSIERLTSRSYANKFQAELLADAAAEDAANRILTAIQPAPYSAAYYAYPFSGSSARHLYLARYTNQSGVLRTLRVPLFSTRFTNFSVFTNLAQAPIETASLTVTNRNDAGSLVATAFTATNDMYVNVNQSNSYFTNGVVGLTNATGPVPLPVNWIYQTNSLGKIVGRYAFWVDDETSKVDLRTAGSAARLNGTNLAEVALSAFSVLGLTSAQITHLENYKSQTLSAKVPSAMRYPLSGSGFIPDAETWNRIRPYLTQYSLHDLRSPDGNLSLNLNEWVTSTTSAARIQLEVETIARAITNNLPDFGKRAYQAMDVSMAAIPTPTEQSNYVKKIAANIRDYLDADSTATVLMEDGSAYTGNAPNFIPYDTVIAEIPIVGKERGPYLNEFALVARVLSPLDENTTIGSTAAVTITVRFGHYVELFNPTSRTISYSDLGSNPRVILANQTPWVNDNGVTIEPFYPANIRMDLPVDFTIPPMGYAVLTTDGAPFTTTTSLNQTGLLGSAANQYSLTKGSGPGTWSLLGTGGQSVPLTASLHEDYELSTQNWTDLRYHVKMDPSEVGYGGSRERLLFVNDQGIIDYVLRIFTSPDLYLGRATRNPAWISTHLADGGTFSRNTSNDSDSSPRFVRGEPRSNTEIYQLAANTSSVWKWAGAAYGDNLYSADPSVNQKTLGAENFNWDDSTGNTNAWRKSWAEYSSAGNNYIANTNLTSVGELGFIYDPARYSHSSSTNGFRPYGRTLRMGQPDSPEFNRNANSSAANDRNWLGGLGTNSTIQPDYLKNAFLLANVFRADNADFGKLNPNGGVRSSARVLLAALYNGFQFESSNFFRSSGSLTGQSLNTNALTSALTNEFAANRALIGLGDVSRLAVFSTDVAGSSISGQNMIADSVSDSDREEVFRRTAGLMNPQSLSYSVYAIGQSGRLVKGQFKPSATFKRHTIIQFQPTYSSTVYPAQPSAWAIVKPWQVNY